MSRAGNPNDIAYAERFMKALKHEGIYVRASRTIADVTAYLPTSQQSTDNNHRLHLALDYQIPIVLEAAHTAVTCQNPTG